MKPPIFLLSGPPAAGKSTISKALLQKFRYGFHIPVDDLRGWVVSGLSNPIGSWDPETDRQFRLARQSAAALALVYAAAGFTVAIDDVIFPEQASAHYDDLLAAYPVHKVLLRPSLEVTLTRNALRERAVEPGLLNNIIEPIHAAFDLEQLQGFNWQLIDSSHLSVEETVTEILHYTGYSPNI